MRCQEHRDGGRKRDNHRYTQEGEANQTAGGDGMQNAEIDRCIREDVERDDGDRGGTECDDAKPLAEKVSTARTCTCASTRLKPTRKRNEDAMPRA